MNSNQVKQAKKMIKEGTYTISEIYKAVFGTEFTDDCTCHNVNGMCNCKAGTNCLKIIILQYEQQ